MYGAQSSWYNLVASISGGAATQLQEGTPVAGSVAKDNYVYYSFQPLNLTSEVIIEVTDLEGDPDFVVGSTLSNQTRPTIADHTWASRGFGKELVQIEPTHPMACAQAKVGQSCQYFIGVTAWDDSADYSILARTKSGVLQRLPLDVPFTGNLAQGEN